MDFGGEVAAVARKAHRCQVCGTPIAPGTTYSRYKGKWMGDWQNWAAHQPCMRLYMEWISPDPTPDGDFHFTDFFGWAQSAGVLDLVIAYYPLPDPEECDDWEREEVEKFKTAAAEQAERRKQAA